MNRKDLNREIIESAQILLENALEGRAGLNELTLFAVRYLRNADLVLDDETRKILNDILDASIAHDYERIEKILKKL